MADSGGSLGDMVGGEEGGTQRPQGSGGQQPLKGGSGGNGRRKLRSAQNGVNPANSGSDDDQAWMQTYLDVITLMLTLFVMLLAYANFDEAGFGDVAESLEGAVSRPQIAPEPPGDVVGDKPGAVVGDQRPAEDEAADKGEDPTKKTREFLEEMRESGMLERVEVAFNEGRITLRLDDKLLFDTGGSDLNPEGNDLMGELVPILEATGRSISVEGHTDNRSIRSDRYNSNWDLSAARAVEVVNFLEGEGIPREQMRAVGYADTRPIADNETAEGRARNRRVSVVLQTERLDAAEEEGSTTMEELDHGEMPDGFGEDEQ
ncbi:MAG: OmpA/MotB family protein [Pseudomonadota bacterium]